MKSVRGARAPLLVVVNADDFGASASINEAICLELECGRVTSATLMANGPAFAQAVRDLGAYRTASFGVHLNLTEYPPLLPSQELRRMLDHDGHLHPGLRYQLFGPRELRAIYSEFAAQIRRVVQAGVQVSHLDSHWHIHTRPDFVLLVKLLQHEFGIQRVRARMNLYPPDQPPSLRNRFAIPACNLALRIRPGNRTTDCMGRLSVFVEKLSAGYKPRFNSIEVMVHPGHQQPDYLSESDLLSSGWTSLLSRPYRLATFWEI